MASMTAIPLFLFSVLFLGHAVGDFVLQTESIVRGKQSSLRILTWHVLQHVLATAALLTLAWPRLILAARDALPSVIDLAIALTCIGLVHLVVDRAKIAAVAKWGRHTTFFLLDQLVHLVTLWGFVQWLMSRSPEWTFANVGPIVFLGQRHDAIDASRAILLAGGLILAMRGGAILVWLTTGGLRSSTAEPDWTAAGLPQHPLKDNTSLVKGYVVRGALLIVLVLWPWWLGLIVLAAYAAAALATLGANPVTRAYRRVDRLVGIGVVLTLAGLVRWVT